MMRWMNTLGGRPGSRVVGIGAPTPLHITNRAFAEFQAGQHAAPRLSVLTPLPEIVARLNDYQPETITSACRSGKTPMRTAFDVAVTVELFDALERAGTGAKEKLVV